MDDLKKYTLLIVDDEEMLRDVLVFEFERKGFTVLSAENGVAAFELVSKNKIDLVISDMRMPEGDGMSLLEKIRKFDSKIPTVIFITGFADVTEAECIAKGAHKVLAKPFNRKELMECVFEALGIAISKVA